ncbi:MAG TPA: GxxExxY protein [Candidatus Angelobacter sp.]
MPESGAKARMNEREISHEIIKAALKVHSALGPGLLESAYKACLAYELKKAGFKVDVELKLPVVYEEVRLEVGYRLDLVVNDLVIVELKSVESITAVHMAQAISYLKLSKKKMCLIMNFNVVHLKDGIKRVVEGTGWK